MLSFFKKLIPHTLTFLASVLFISVMTSDRIGATITTINGSDRITDSRSTINTNFSNLNTDKLESGSSGTNLTLGSTTVGLLTATSTVNFFSALTVSSGGTGSSTLSANQVLLGNGTGNIGVVSGFGSSGQVLTSNGAGSAPTFQSTVVNQNIDYTWTAHHIFSSLFATNATTTNATSTNLEFTRGRYLGTVASSSILSVDTNGNITANPLRTPRYTFATTTDVICSGTPCSATSTTFTIPSSFLTGSSTIEVIGNVSITSNGSGNGACNLFLRKSSDSSNVASTGLTTSNSSETLTGPFRIMIRFKDDLLTSQTALTTGIAMRASGATYAVADLVSNQSPSIDLTGSPTLVMVVTGSSNLSECRIPAFTLIVNQ